jgi:hypothetical protein
MRIPAPLRLAVLSVVVSTLSACATAEDYLTSINPFRRADQAAAPQAAPPPPASVPPAAPTPLPQPRPSEAPR